MDDCHNLLNLFSLRESKVGLLPFCFQMHSEIIHFYRLILFHLVNIYLALVLLGIGVGLGETVLDILSSIPTS